METPSQTHPEIPFDQFSVPALEVISYLQKIGGVVKKKKTSCEKEVRFDSEGKIATL